MTTLYIHPAWSDQAGQCRIYVVDDTRPSDQWREVGLMDSRGNVRCIEPEFAALRDDVPLMAGTYYPLP